MAYTAPTVGLFGVPPAVGATVDGFTYPEVDLFDDASTLLGVGDYYLDLPAANNYFSSSFKAAAWGALTDPQKTVAIAEATKWLDTLCWKGEKCSAAQPLSWPRKIQATGCCAATSCDVLPPAVIQAAAELALALHNSQGALIGTAAATAALGPVKRQKLDALEVEYFDPRSSGAATSGATSPKGPLVLQRFPWLRDLLKCYADLGGNALMRRVRS